MQRYAITVEGTVQGVGFRPFVYRLASELQLSGFVSNHSGSVAIEAEGPPERLTQFLEALEQRPPPLARITSLKWTRLPLGAEPGFRINPSRACGPSQACGPRHVAIAPDIATCAECLAEVADPLDRRYRYPLTNCTACGPRLTIITGSPYDRPQTTMSVFPMCGDCRSEYETAGDRRFHAQPIACPACGPQLELLDCCGERIVGSDPLVAFAERIRSGQIGAVKGLGGYHLVCLAESDAAVGELRRRKLREEKPFAILVPDLQRAAEVCEFDTLEADLLSSPPAPIVLLRRRERCPLAAAVAPGNPRLGVMLPHTPLHHLLLDALDGAAVVLTSGNRTNEPIAYRDEEVVERLRGIAEVYLTHNRAIHVRSDDSVVRVIGGAAVPLRRSRGYAPQPLRLAVDCARSTIAVGGQQKTTFALARGGEAILSHHLGDLDDWSAYQAFASDMTLYEQLFQIRPERIVHDLHPGYASTRYAVERADREGLERIAVQHHHAHMASCMADNGLRFDQQVIGVTLDGTGFGTDGAIWGGEFLVGDCYGFRRAAHLRYVAMPGGEQAIREPWRMAAAHARDAGTEPLQLKRQLPRLAWQTVETMLERQLNCPQTSSMGRLFDAVAALAGVRRRSSYDGQAAAELEWLACGEPPSGSYPFELQPEPAAATPAGNAAGLVVDTRPLIRAVVEEVRCGMGSATVARRFHSTLVELIHTVCCRLRKRDGLHCVVLSGGVFCNGVLTSETLQRLESDGFTVYRHRQVPPGDGGLSLGQLAVAAAAAESSRRSGATAAVATATTEKANVFGNSWPRAGNLSGAGPPDGQS